MPPSLRVSEAQSAGVNDSPVDCQSRRPGRPQAVAERSEDGGSVVCTVGHSPSHGMRRARPHSEGAKGCRRKGERYMKATGIVRRVEAGVIITQKSLNPL